MMITRPVELPRRKDIQHLQSGAPRHIHVERDHVRIGGGQRILQVGGIRQDPDMQSYALGEFFAETSRKQIVVNDQVRPRSHGSFNVHEHAALAG